VARMWLLCGFCVAPVAPLRLPLRLYCESSGLVCCSLVLLCDFTLTRLWLLCGSSPLCRCFLCGSDVAAMRHLCGSCSLLRLHRRVFCGSVEFLCCSHVLPCGLNVTRLWLLCGSSPLSRWLFCDSSVAPMQLLRGSSTAPVAPLLCLLCGTSVDPRAFSVAPLFSSVASL
jgi:hypothetical protein